MGVWTTTPRTWAAAEKVTATLLNEQLRNFADGFGAWTAYTPTLSVFTPGNGTATGAYLRVNKMVVFRASFTFGSTSAAAAGQPTLTLPVTLTGTGPVYGRFVDTSASGYYDAGVSVGITTVGLLVTGTNGLLTNCSTTFPFVWATGDSLSVSGVYEAA
jgi:hypothetical protein